MARHICIPGYRIEREVGRGGIATVYLARQESLDRDVALKVMSPALVSEPSFTERFLREGRTVAGLNHPSIVTIYDIEVAEFQPYIAMEYLSGGSLKDKMRARVSPRTTLAVIGQIAAALSYAHRQGVVHRDVKPENILFRGRKSAVLTDFGIAKTAAKDPSLTTAGIIVGTPRYMSPEQADGRGADHRSDIYALGVILYELLTGTAPYDGKDSIGLLCAHINESIPRLPVELSRFQHLVDGMMAKNPTERVPDCAEVLTLIRGTRNGSSVATGTAALGRSGDPSAGQGNRPTASGAWTRAALSGVALVAMLMLGVWYAAARNAEPARVTAHPEPTASAGRADHREPAAAAPPSAWLPMVVPEQLAAEDRERAVAVITPDQGASMPPVAASAPAAAPPAVVAGTRARMAAQHIGSLLKLADKQVEVGQLSLPPGDNAVETYRSILRQWPEHTEARRGLRRVADEYLRRARTAMVQKDYVMAQSSIGSGLKIVANHRSLNALQTRVKRVLEAEQEFAQGMKHKNGDGVPRDIAQAIRNFSRAAALGHGAAQYQLGVAYANGVGTVRDEEQALRWLRHAAQQGHPEARFNFGLGLLFGPSPDPARAARWMKRLGEEEYKPAYRVLGWMYGTGTGTERSIKKSLKWYFKRKMKNMFGEPALPKHVISLWQEQFENALSESTQGAGADVLQPG
ncbi:MAG: serine/threonine-protein kinase [Gammaproteobacteria bacterium]|nr:serine/threonine-protein kinase [Gammaproteobacteria bacterium]